MKDRTILGHIDCPTCGTAAGMRITPDKNGEPFGYCEANCGQQLRIGGDKRRVRDFLNLYPAMRAESAEATPAPAPAAAPAAPAAPTAPATKAAAPTAPTKPEAKRRSAFEDALSILGVNP